MNIKFEILNNEENQPELFVNNSSDSIFTDIVSSLITRQNRIKTNNYNLDSRPGLNKMLVSPSFKNDLEKLTSIF